ncbi:TetR/AcrR family transcriptional regulator [Leucobacter sp. MMO-75]
MIRGDRLGSLGSREGNARGERTRKALLEAAGSVFAGAQYGDARLLDISTVAGVNAGLIHFHFGNKEDLAAELLNEYRSRIDAVFASSSYEVSAADRIIRAFKELARVIASDPILQAGLSLSLLPPAALAKVSQAPTAAWREAAAVMVREGIEDGSVHPNADPEALASFIYDLFVGAQVISGTSNQWTSFPDEAERLALLVQAQLKDPVWKIEG